MKQLMPTIINDLETTEDITYLENRAREIIDIMDMGKSLLSLIIYNIHERELYKNIVDERGLSVYPTWSDYLPHLAKTLAISPATVYNYLRPAKIAMNHITPHEYLEQDAFRIYKEIPKYVEVDRNGKTDTDVSQVVVNVLSLETNEEPLTVSDIHINLREQFGVDETIIYYQVKESEVYYVIETYESGILAGREREVFLNLEMLPDVVRKNIIKTLHIGDYDEN